MSSNDNFFQIGNESVITGIPYVSSDRRTFKEIEKGKQRYKQDTILQKYRPIIQNKTLNGG